MRAFATLVLLASVGAIYPDDHWTYSTKLTTDNADATIKEAIDAGKTMFVRWIASEG
jgi:hypothetical protein